MPYLKPRVQTMARYRFNDPIPTDIAADVLEYALRNWETWKRDNSFGKENERWERCTGKQFLAEILVADYGLSVDTWEKRILRILDVETEFTSINVLDHLLVALGQSHLWYVDPLAEYYFAGLEEQAA